ncbi:MAG: helix-turn-helix transcriptional regulator [Pyrinomonadaceae bacterium]
MNEDINVLYREIGRRIFEERDKKGFTQAELASKVSLTRTSITNIEKGKQKILVHVLIRIAEALEVNLESLIPNTKKPLDNKIVNKYLEGFSDEARKFAESVLNSIEKE